MAVVIRLQRAGGRNRPFYRVVATDSRTARDGRFIEKLGFYNPLRDPIELSLDVAKIDEWVSKGARTSDTVAQLLKSYRTKVAAESQVQAE